MFGRLSRLLLVIAVVGAAMDLDDERPPHVLLIVADDLGWADVGYHGSFIETPVLDRLAAEGIRLERHYAAALCTPSRAMLLTGRHAIQTGVHTVIDHSEPNGLGLEFPTLADRLKTVGYHTHLVGKWHLGMFQPEYFPTRRGFDSHYGFLQGINDYYDHSSLALNGLTGYDSWLNEDLMLNDTGYATSDQANAARHIIGKHDAEDPLFLFLSLQAPHRPFQDPPGSRYPYTNGLPEDDQTYANMVSFMDEQIGRVVESLKDAAMWNNSLVIFMSDNGSPVLKYNGALRGKKMELWDGGVRVPALVTGGRIRTQGVISEDYVHITDWFPTLLAMAGVSDSGDRDIYGMNVFETIIHGRASPRHELLLDIYPHLPSPLEETFGLTEGPKAALIKDQWKLVAGQLDDVHIDNGTIIISERFPIELYDIKEDPAETQNLATDHPLIVESMIQRLMTYYQSQVPPRTFCLDPRANPAFHTNCWVPWMKEGAQPEDPLHCVEDQEEQDLLSVASDEAGQSSGSTWIVVLSVLGLFVTVVALLFLVKYARRRRGSRLNYEVMR